MQSLGFARGVDDGREMQKVSTAEQLRVLLWCAGNGSSKSSPSLEHKRSLRGRAAKLSAWLAANRPPLQQPYLSPGLPHNTFQLRPPTTLRKPFVSQPLDH